VEANHGMDLALRWSVTWICSGRSRNSTEASMTSRPLFMRVAESIVILGPIFHVGWFRASSTVAAWMRPRGQSRKGPPLAVIRTSRIVSEGRPSRS